MDKELDLWGDINYNIGSTNDILTLIENQAKLLEEKSKGQIKADFSRVKYQYKSPNPMATITDIVKSYSMITSSLSPKAEIIENDNYKDLENASSLFEQAKYRLVIYSTKYKFRLFTLDYQSTYPIELEVEYGILDDNLVKKEINSFEQMKDILLSIFTSNKVRFIIQKMLELEAI